MELIQRTRLENFDNEEPQYFSISMVHEHARINLHWPKAPAEGRQRSFHVEGLSQHLLLDGNGIRAIARAIARAIKNILDYGADARLRRLCKALDAYRETVVRDREANARRKEGHEILIEAQAKQRPRRNVHPPSPLRTHSII
jgi:hypothetical protein